MKKQNVYVGIDISKRTLDISVYRHGEHQSLTISNTIAAVRKFLKQQSCAEEHLIIGMENTGKYNWPLLSVLADHPGEVYVIAPLHLSRSLGLVRGKSDRIDAERICRFTQKNHQELTAWKPRRAVIEELGLLLSERKRLQKMRGQIIRADRELEIMDSSDTMVFIRQTNADLVAQLDDKIKRMDRTLSKLITSDDALSHQSELLQSITGVGKVLCWNLLFKTNEFKTIQNPRKLACYAGVVPFEYSSGTSVRGKKRVSSFADREFKSILHMAAMRAVRIEGELQVYYLRKVDEGKNKMSVLNAVRNKIIHRAFAVIKHKKPYQTNLVLS